MAERNLVEAHRRSCEDLGPGMALRYKGDGLFRDLTWEDYRKQARQCAAALAAAGIEKGQRVGLLSENRVEWPLADLGILTAGAVNVSPHAPLTAGQIQFQLFETQTVWLFVSSLEQMDKIRAVRRHLPDLRGVVVFERAACGDDNLWWPAFLDRGRLALREVENELVRREASTSGDDLAAILYTSGTTGNSKGVMLTHRNLLSNAQACIEAAPRAPDSLSLGWLPLSHIYARTVDHYGSLVAGTTLALAQSSETVVPNLMELQPTHLSCVPRFYEKLLAIMGGNGSNPEATGIRLRAIFGPRMEWLGSGGAPLPPAVAHAYHASGFNILQGYGLTETSPVLTFNRKDHFKLETVGQAIRGVELKIADDGEILTRGPQVMAGYWNDREGTQRALRDGWFHTGDLGQIDAEGFLTITGRKKDLLVLSNGKKVAPAQIEGILTADPCVDEAIVFGEGRNFLTALIVPNWSNLRSAMTGAGVPVASLTDAALSRLPQTRAFLQERFDSAQGLVANWERVKSIVLLEKPLSIADGELTVSMKVRREAVFQRHHAELEQLYPGTE
jgi:long-chain acyl-CoA synthetase